jgi:hypothetical protein
MHEKHGHVRIGTTNSAEPYETATLATEIAYEKLKA